MTRDELFFNLQAAMTGRLQLMVDGELLDFAFAAHREIERLEQELADCIVACRRLNIKLDALDEQTP